MHTHQKDSFKNDLIEYANTDLKKEVCGFVCYKDDKLIFKPAKNHSNDDDIFLINPADFLQVKLTGELLAIFHTHVSGREDPSEYDIKNSKNCLCPFLIYSLATKRFNLFDMPNFQRSEKGVIMLKEYLDD
jgi:proteasome lid subunit RPN8/RPN11